MGKAPMWVAALLAGLVLGYLAGSAPGRGAAAAAAADPMPSAYQDGYVRALYLDHKYRGEVTDPCWACEGQGYWKDVRSPDDEQNEYADSDGLIACPICGGRGGNLAQ